MGIEKVVLGVILVIGSLYYISKNTFGALQDLKVVINGAVPLLMLVLGIIIVWLQLDELAVERVLSEIL